MLMTDHVDGARLRLWTAATKWNEHGKPQWNDIHRGKLLIGSPELSVSSTSSHIVASTRNERMKWWIWPCEVFLFILHKWCYTYCKILRHGASESTSTSPPKEGVLRILIAIKSPSLQPGMNPRSLGPTGITLTITPPRWLYACYLKLYSLLYYSHADCRDNKYEDIKFSSLQQ
jgi:hypothetical protein